MAERVKGPREVRKTLFNFQELISEGATVLGYQGYASREEIVLTTLAAQLNPEDPTVLLNDNPLVGALLIVDPGDEDLEETFKVTSVTPSGPDFLCGILPSAERQHVNTAPAQFEPGESSRFLIDDTPTPSGTNGVLADVRYKEGADAHTYRVNLTATCDNGEVREDEIEIDVQEFVPTTSIDKQPADIVDVAIGFADWTTKYSTTVLTAIAFIARTRPLTTTVNGSNAQGATTLNINASPGIGALLTVNVGQPTQEKLLVSVVSGAVAPFACSVSPLQFLHSNAEPVSYFPGVNTRVLVSTVASSPDVFCRLRRATAGQTYQLIVLATLADGQVAQKSITVVVKEE